MALEWLKDKAHNIGDLFTGATGDKGPGPKAAPTPAAAPMPAQAPADPAQAAAPFEHFAEPGAAAAPGDAAAATQAKPQGVLDKIYHGLTDWHFEGRDAKNGPAPSQEELDKKGSGWEELPPWMTVYHDNHVGKPEHKYINPDGRESVKDGDTGAEVTDPRYKATYNYVSPMQWSNVHGVGDAAKFAARSVGHFAADILPYWIGGNVRGPG